MYYVQNQRYYVDTIHKNGNKDVEWIDKLNNLIDVINRKSFNLSLSKKDTWIVSLSGQFGGII